MGYSKAVLVMIGLITQYGYIQAMEELLYGHEDPSKNLVDNWNFEEDISSSKWRMQGAKGANVSGGFIGQYALHVSERSGARSGAYQAITTLKPDTNYYMSTHLKFPWDPPAGTGPYIKVTTFASTLRPNGQRIMSKTAYLTFQLPSNEWQQIGGNFKTTDQEFTHVDLFIQVDPAGVDYLMDAVALTEIPPNPDWRKEADERIAQHRKAPLNIVGHLSPEVCPDNITVKVELVRHEFGFGTAIKAHNFAANGDVNKAYRDFVFKYFNWAVFENDMKWRGMERHRGFIRYEPTDNAMAFLEAKNFSVRGHALVWSVKANNPDWVQALEGEELKQAVKDRIVGFMDHYKGKLVELDVCNEYLQKHFFEDATGELDMLELEMRLAHQIDKDVSLCLNDYLVLRNGGWQTSNQANLAMRLKREGVPLGCIGVQSHLKSLPLVPEIMQKRLQILAQANVPISITELSLHSSDVNVRAEALDTAFRVYFAHPSVTSITAWGFSDQFNPFSNNYAWTEGPEFVPNAAGDAFINLVTKEWHTSVNFTPPTNAFTETVSAFKGKYKMTVEEHGVVKLEKDFVVSSGDNTVEFTLISSGPPCPKSSSASVQSTSPPTSSPSTISSTLIPTSPTPSSAHSWMTFPTVLVTLSFIWIALTTVG